jgi:hypothetical protein
MKAAGGELMKILRAAALLTLLNMFLYAQIPGVGGILSKRFPGTPKTTAQTGTFAGYLRAATDQGIKGLEELAAVFPPDKVAHLKELTNSYHRAIEKQTEINGEAFTIATDAAKEMASLEEDWQSYNKAAAKSVRKAHARFALMLTVDAFAGGEIPAEQKKVERELTAEEGSLKKVFHGGGQSSTDQANQQKLQDELNFLKAASQQIPEQQKSFTSVQRIAKNIADAEHFQLKPDPAPNSIKTTSDVQKSSADIDAAFPD